MTRKASIKETGEEISQADWARFDAAVATEKAEHPERMPTEHDDVAGKPDSRRPTAPEHVPRREKAAPKGGL